MGGRDGGTEGRKGDGGRDGRTEGQKDGNGKQELSWESALAVMHSWGRTSMYMTEAVCMSMKLES